MKLCWWSTSQLKGGWPGCWSDGAYPQAKCLCGKRTNTLLHTFVSWLLLSDWSYMLTNTVYKKLNSKVWQQFFIKVFTMLSQIVPSGLLSMVASITTTTYFKESDWPLKNFQLPENCLKKLPWSGEQSWGYKVKEHKMLCQKQVSKVTLVFVWGQLWRKQQWRLESTT